MCKRFLLRYRVAFSWPYLPGRRKTKKHPKYHIFSVISEPVWRTRPTKIRISLCQLYRNLSSIHMYERFRDTTVTLVQKVHRFDSCAIGQVMLHSSALCPYSTKAKTMVKSTVSVLFASLCAKDREPRFDAPWSNTKSRIIHKQRTFHDQRPECALLFLKNCSVAFSLSHAALYFRLNPYQESKTHAK